VHVAHLVVPAGPQRDRPRVDLIAPPQRHRLMTLGPDLEPHGGRRLADRLSEHQGVDIEPER
jgi:hypothetical protein